MTITENYHVQSVLCNATVTDHDFVAKSCGSTSYFVALTTCICMLKLYIKTHSHVSAAKRDTRRTVCYLQEAKSF